MGNSAFARFACHTIVSSVLALGWQVLRTIGIIPGRRIPNVPFAMCSCDLEGTHG
jgi:hypothetical protein